MLWSLLTISCLAILCSSSFESSALLSSAYSTSQNDGSSLDIKRRMLNMTKSYLSFSSFFCLVFCYSRPCCSLYLKYSLSFSNLDRKSHTLNPLVLLKSQSCTCKLFRILLVREVKAMRALFLILQLSLLNASVARIMAGVTNFLTSCLSIAS